MRKILLLLIISSIYFSCENRDGISEEEFISLMNNVARGWSNQNTPLALSSFDNDAIYMEPPNTQYYRGHTQLKPYFDELGDQHNMVFHNLWFNRETQSGAGEFTFSYGEEIADIGIVVVEIEKGKIKFWREYHKKGPSEFKKFIEIEGKDWEWHIGNYPEPKDSISLNGR